MKDKSISHKKLWWCVIGSISVILLLLAAIGAYCGYYAEKVLPRTTLANIAIDGKTPNQLNKFVDSKIKDMTIEITAKNESTGSHNNGQSSHKLVNKVYKASLADFGCKINLDDLKDEIFKHNKSIFSRVNSLFKDNKVEPKVSCNNDKLNAYAEKIASDFGGDGKNASVSWASDASKYVVTPAVLGKYVNSKQIKDGVEQLVSSMSSGKINIKVDDLSPNVSNRDAEQIRSQAEAFLNTSIAIKSGRKIIKPARNEQVSWISVPAIGEKTAVKIDKPKMSKWVEGKAKEAHKDAVTGERNVNEDGGVINVSKEAVAEANVVNAQDVANQLGVALEAKKPAVAEFKFDKKELKWKDRKILKRVPTGNLAYAATPDEKWIDVNLSNFTTTPYIGANPAHSSFSMVPGKPTTPTVVGQYRIYSKLAEQTMRGVDNGKPWAAHVTSVMYWYRGYAFHAANWRASFGYGGPTGSHGCINMSPSDARWLFNFANEGTVVVSHY